MFFFIITKARFDKCLENKGLTKYKLIKYQLLVLVNGRLQRFKYFKKYTFK